ncbi:MAG: DUF2232 domain-containing protein [Coriobacteriia bacterium]|nr:DUF2232 domain-containing protein [Coriobacteriia bacterium]
MFDTLLLSVATIFGVVLAPMLPYVGVPIAAAGVAGLVYQDRLSAAVFGAVVGSVAAIAMSPVSAVFVIPVVLAVFFTVLMLPRTSVQRIAVVLIGVLAAATVGVSALAARLVGTTVSVQIATLFDEFGKGLGSSASAELLSQLSSAARLFGTIWPGWYFREAVFVGVITIMVVGWSAKKLEQPIEIPSLKQLDLTPHILWAFVSGLFLLAASYSSIPMAAAMGTVGTNLLLCAWPFLFIQGLSVMAAVLEKVGISSVGRVFGLVGFAVLDALTLAVSFTGLVDFWFNFRRLPRDGFTPSAPEHEVSDR